MNNEDNKISDVVIVESFEKVYERTDTYRTVVSLKKRTKSALRFLALLWDKPVFQLPYRADSEWVSRV